jgi:integrase
MRKALTAKTIDALKPQAKRYEVHDALCPGFSVRISPLGGRTFYVRYRYGIRQRRLKLGVYPRISLGEAREQAMATLRQVDDGMDPYARRRQLNHRVEAVVAQFISQYARPRNKSWREAERILNREFVSTHGQRDVRQVTRGDILEMIDQAIERGAPYQANRIHSHLRKFFNFCLSRAIIETSPMLGTKAPTREKARDRVLTQAELASLIKACRAEPYPFGPYTLMLILTGQRRGEVASMAWSSIDWENKVWEIPGDRSKNGKPHRVPLSPLALSVLKDIPRAEGTDLVFTTTRTTPISGITKMVNRLQDASETRNWRLHDLRRTAATEMAKMGIAPHVVEKVLNHISGTISGVAAVYNRYGYDAEKRDALDRWAWVIDQISAHDGIQRALQPA